MNTTQPIGGSGPTVAYLRTATVDRVESKLSLARQQDACEDYARSLGTRISRAYSDVGARVNNQKGGPCP
jgi:hypothetical protein